MKSLTILRTLMSQMTLTGRTAITKTLDLERRSKRRALLVAVVVADAPGMMTVRNRLLVNVIHYASS